MQIVSRDEARHRGLRSYFTGVPCRNGHVRKRSTKNTKCFGCEQVKKSKAYYAQRPAAQERLAAKAARAAARLEGAKSYVGHSCRQCGGRQRFVRSNACAACSSRRQRRKGKKAHTLAGKLRRGAPSDTRPASTVVYVISAGPFCKIGVTDILATRLKQIQTGCPFPAVIAHTTEALPPSTATWLERVVHKYLHAKRTVGEWFEVSVTEAIDAVTQLSIFE